jgi:biopolymer transport protein ExbD
MAGNSLYRDDDDLTPITEINVTPFVDVALVLLVVFMVTAKLFVARGIEVDKPKEATGGEVSPSLRITVTVDGTIYVNRDAFDNDAAAVARIEELARTATDKPKALIAGDRHTQYGNVVHAIAIAQQAGITAIALENEQP